MSFQDHFSTQASSYAKSRPTYPPALFEWLARLAPGRALAWDAGSGNGQAAVALAAHFERVVATEPSAAQLAQATAHARVSYQQAAETAPMLEDRSVDLLTVAQAAHWFDRPLYYAEVRRVARAGALVALWTYTHCLVTPEIDAKVYHFYDAVVGPYWPPERVHCVNGYRDFDFPFDELEFPITSMELTWDLDAFLAYLDTWSAVDRYRKEQRRDPIPELRGSLLPLWGDSTTPRRIAWPLAGRVGYVR